jgi:hypothetical protein
MTQFIDDELSEIIDARDYLDDFIGKVIWNVWMILYWILYML